ncbi:UPF0261 protein [Leminorella grimontii]|uniref:UPF0261 protein SOASR030_25370 n=1 Tax=Leminorella grimontii TaxID=82981 RepID=A0AAV5N361_9GAMM|nr:Tm-1-like ATP-binding domain-containing protein [Leminorella grimontii]KFC94683.1 transcriptional regulator [Leminorella grimontii ATCC 33999 = DSM 5078]GKX56425.1 UPF0261 protein [Leminorella grimontii]GKX59974.1 UPF0261 protein [Leminorella grimontii]VFS61279.1 Uncharacterized conserved protein [Leminorella grimontii]
MEREKGRIYVATTLDTKGAEAFYVRDLIKKAGLEALAVDLSTKDANANYGADVSAATVAACHPQGAQAVFCGDRGRAITEMAVAFERFLGQRDDVAALLGLGGSGGTALVTPAMQALPVGTPKLMVSTMASGDVSHYIGASDIAMMYSVTDVAGLNRISRKVLKNAANQIAGAVKFYEEESVEDKPAIGLTMFGVTTPCIQQITEQLEGEFDCLVFHATGSGGRAMEKLVDGGLLNGVLDITTTEVCDYLFGGVLACSKERFDAVANAGIPCVMSCGALDMVNFGSPDTVPEKYADRLFYHHNPQVTLMRTTPEENRKMGEWIGEKLNQYRGDVLFLIPEGGFSAIDSPGGPFWLPEANRAFIEALESTVVQTDKRRIIKLPHNVNDRAFTERAVAEFIQLFHR